MTPSSIEVSPLHHRDPSELVAVKVLGKVAGVSLMHDKEGRE